MPGKVGMRPENNRRSVPVLMPLHRVRTTTSYLPAGARSKRRKREIFRLFQDDGERIQREAPFWLDARDPDGLSRELSY